MAQADRSVVPSRHESPPIRNDPGGRRLHAPPPRRGQHRRARGADGRHSPGEPAPPAPRLLGLLGEYDTPAGMRVVLEDSGRLFFADTMRHRAALRPTSNDAYAIAPTESEALFGRSAGEVRFVRDASGRATAAMLGDVRLSRREIEPRPGTNQLQVTPVRPVGELRTEALAASPPQEQGSFRPAESGRARATRSVDQARDPLRDDEQLPRHALLRRGACIHAAARRRSRRSRERIAEITRLRTSDSRRLSSVVRDQDVLGRDADREALARRRSEPGLEAQPRRRGRPHAVRSRRLASPSKCRARTTRAPIAHSPIIRAERLLSGGVVPCCAVRWKRRDSS